MGFQPLGDTHLSSSSLGVGHVRASKLSSSSLQVVELEPEELERANRQIQALVLLSPSLGLATFEPVTCHARLLGPAHDPPKHGTYTYTFCLETAHVVCHHRRR